MEKFVVKKEKLASRCEICHKTDKFNPKKNYCKRCYKFNPTYKNKADIKIGFLSESKSILFLCWKGFLIVVISSALGLVGLTIAALLSASILDFLDPLDDMLALLLSIIGFMIGFIGGIKIILFLFRKPLVTNDSLNEDITNLENQPYYIDSKNIYS